MSARYHRRDRELSTFEYTFKYIVIGDSGQTLPYPSHFSLGLE